MDNNLEEIIVKWQTVLGLQHKLSQQKKQNQIKTSKYIQKKIMYYSRVSKIEIISSKKNKEGHTEYCINAYYQNLMNPIQFKSRYSTLLELHKSLIPLNKKDSLPQFPGKNLFGTKSQDLIQKRLSDINEYFDVLLKTPQLGGLSIIINFINNKSTVKKELCWQLQVRNRIELFKYYLKEKKPISNTLNQKVYKLIKNGQPFVLKKYGLDDEMKDSSSLEDWRTTVDSFSHRISKIRSDKYLSMIEQLFINNDPQRKCKCKPKKFFTKLWIVTPYYENTLESEIDFRFKNKKSFSSNEIMEIFKNIMRGLEELYINQLYHRNLKPQNVGIVKQSQKSVYQLMDYHDLLLKKKEKTMAQGNGNSNRYSINLAYKSPKRISQIRLITNSKNRDEDYKNFDMYALGIILLQLCLVLPTSELQGFQDISQLRDEMIDNQLQQIKQKYDESLYQHICVLLNKSTLLSVFSNQDKDQLQKLSIFDIVYSKLFNVQQNNNKNKNTTQISPQVSPPKNNENNISSAKNLSEQSTTCGSSSQDIENQQKQADQEIQQEKQGILEYADECFILKYQQNSENLIQQKKTQHILRILLSELNLDNEQIKQQLLYVKEPSNFKGYASISLAKNEITNDLGIILKDFILSLENIDSISIDLKESQKISANLILNILESIQERKQINRLLIDISKCPQITSECINSIIIKVSQISHLLLFSLYFFNSNLNEETLLQLEILSQQFKSQPLIKFMYTF
ncbi:hypothetical protein ABPG72_016155 [Tetrahymena utriculariae]